MKRCSGLLSFLLLVGATAVFAQTAPDAVIADPDHHQVILENDHVRVIQALASPGARSPLHSHPPLVLVSLDRGRGKMTTSEGTGILDVYPGQVLWLGAPFEHSWEMVAGTVNIVGVEVKSAGTGQTPSPGPLPANTAVTLDPVHHNVILDNEHVRVFSALASRGETSPMHSHPPTVLISLGRARSRLTLPDGTTAIIDLTPGQVIWLEDASHAWEIVSGEVEIIGVEIKSAQM
jgi:quercetin dioxygenase-like cupin family protein